MRNPRQYPRSLLIAQGVVVAVYIVIGVVLYYYCGSYVASPALGSAGGTVKKISYGIALPGLIVTATIVAHVKKNQQSQHLEKWLTSSIIATYTDSGEICLPAHPPRLQASNQQLSNALDYLAQLYLRHCSDCLYHRQRDSGLRFSGLTHRLLAGDYDVFPADGMHVVV